jgi:hypothetical protein
LLEATIGVSFVSSRNQLDLEAGMKVHTDSTHRKARSTQDRLARLSLGKLDISTEEILADLRYPSAPNRERRG